MIHERYNIVDLTQPLYDHNPTWSGSCGFCLEVKQDYDCLFRVQQMQMDAGIGTHIDAPSHLIQGGASVEVIPLENLIIEACVLNVSARAHENYEISREDVEQFEKVNGIIPRKSIVVAFTGWSRFWRNPEAYRNVDSKGQMHFPAFSANAVEHLLKRDISGIAIDTLSPDCLDTAFPVHRLVLGAGKYIIENLGDCSKLPSRGAYLIVLPLKIENGTEAPTRIVGLLPKQNEWISAVEDDHSIARKSSEDD